MATEDVAAVRRASDESQEETTDAQDKSGKCRPPSYSLYSTKHPPQETTAVFLLTNSHLSPEDMSESLVMRENLQRQLQEIMSATKLTTGRRTSVRLSRMGSGSVDSAPHTPNVSWAGRNGNRRTLEALRYGLIMKKCGYS